MYTGVHLQILKMVEYLKQKIDKMLITSWQIHGGLLYYSLPTFMLENFNTHKLKINEVVSK